MLVFRYDKSFDGLLSALFDAYSMRAFPEALIGPGEPEPLFTERVHDVATDEAHAGRVWRGLERRLTARTRSMFVYAWHGEQPQGDLLHATRTVGPLTALLGPEPVVTSNHHQAVDRLGEGLAVLQRAADGTAECIRHGTLPVWGVQWHPERQSYALRRPDAADGAAVFEAFAAQVEQE